MTFFGNREKAFENQFAREHEMEFRVLALRTKYLGLWIAGQFGLIENEAEAYAQALIETDLHEKAHEAKLSKIRQDYAQRNIVLDEALLVQKMAEYEAQARQELL